MTVVLGNHFLALVPDDATAASLTAIAERLRAWELPARWVHPLDYHCTLHFLGELDEAEANAVHWSVDEVGRALVAPPSSPTLPGLGAFAGRRQPRVVYAVVADESGWLADLHADLHAALGEEPPAWTPHVTLCRPQPGPRPAGRDWPELLAAHGQAAWGRCGFRELALLAADRSAPPGAPRYRSLAAWPVPPASSG